MKKGFTLVEIMIVAAIIALLIIVLLARFLTPIFLRARINANESYAKSILRSISTGCEDYAKAHNGSYPQNIAALTEAEPPYLNQDYTAKPAGGYNFVCEDMSVLGYSCTATPVTCRVTGTKIFIITTGGVLTSADCE